MKAFLMKGGKVEEREGREEKFKEGKETEGKKGRLIFIPIAD